MHMNLKKILILIICIMIQTICVVSANEDATQSAEFQNMMQKVRQMNSEERPGTPSKNTSEATPTQTQVVPQPINNNIPNNIVVPTMPNVQYPPVTIPTYVSDRQIKYDKIRETYKNLSDNKNDTDLCSQYINAVEDYRRTYGDILLKSENRDNYIQIMQRLGLAYENTSRINDGIATYEILQKEKPADLNIKKHLLSLYDETTACIDAENMLSQIKMYEPSYNINLKNCSETQINQVRKSNNFDINNDKGNDTHKNNSLELSLTDPFWNIIFIIIAILAVGSMIFGSILEQKEKKEEAIRREYEEDLRKQIELERLEQERKQKELEEKRRIQEEYRRKQIENQRLEQERKQREIEEQKRKNYERELRKQKKYWQNMHWRNFEHKIGELFEDLGYEVIVTQGGHDGGVDLLVWKENKKTIVQCKRYNGHSVKIGDVRALWGVKDSFQADSVIMVALSGVTKDGEIFIQNHFPNYELWTVDTIIAKAKEANYSYNHF